LAEQGKESLSHHIDNQDEALQQHLALILELPNNKSFCSHHNLNYYGEQKL
jgi:hypothetical protein